MSPHWARRVDQNHRDVRAAVEARGGLWLDVAGSRLPCDSIVVVQGHWTPLEVKNGALSPSRRTLTPLERAFHDKLRAHGITVEIVTGPNDGSLDVLFPRPREYYRP